MTPDFFQGQIERLRGVYSAASLSGERTQVLWARFKSVENQQFEQAVSHLIGEYTTQALPGISRFEEAVSKYRANSRPGQKQEPLEPSYTCEPCKDFGYGWIGDTVTRCVTCERGRCTTDEEIAHHQASYDCGKALFKGGFRGFQVGKPLPYNPSQRIKGAV